MLANIVIYFGNNNIYFRRKSVQKLFTEGFTSEYPCNKVKANGKRCARYRRFDSIEMPNDCFMIPIRIKTTAGIKNIEDLESEITINGFE